MLGVCKELPRPPACSRSAPVTPVLSPKSPKASPKSSGTWGAPRCEGGKGPRSWGVSGYKTLKILKGPFSRDNYFPFFCCCQIAGLVLSRCTHATLARAPGEGAAGQGGASQSLVAVPPSLCTARSCWGQGGGHGRALHSAPRPIPAHGGVGPDHPAPCSSRARRHRGSGLGPAASPVPGSQPAARRDLRHGSCSRCQEMRLSSGKVFAQSLPPGPHPVVHTRAGPCSSPAAGWGSGEGSERCCVSPWPRTTRSCW